MLKYPSLNSEAVAIADTGCGWVVTEKVHGSNFQFQLDADGTLRVFSRNHPLTVPGMCEGSVLISPRYMPLLERIRPCMLALGPGLSVFGELYGGAYPGCKHEGKPVQKEVLYCPTYEFIAFDVYDHAAKSFWNWDTTRERCEAAGLRVVPELLRTSDLARAIEFLDDPAFHSTPSCVPKRVHGLPTTYTNIMEGVVVRPLVEPRELDLFSYCANADADYTSRARTRTANSKARNTYPNPWLPSRCRGNGRETGSRERDSSTP